MTQRNQLGGAFGRENTRDARHREHVALLDRIRLDCGESARPHANDAARRGYPIGDVLRSDVDHPRLARTADMRERVCLWFFFHFRLFNVLVQRWLTVFVRANAFDLEQCQACSNTELSALIARTVAAISRNSTKNLIS